MPKQRMFRNEVKARSSIASEQSKQFSHARQPAQVAPSFAWMNFLLLATASGISTPDSTRFVWEADGRSAKSRCSVSNHYGVCMSAKRFHTANKGSEAKKARSPAQGCPARSQAAHAKAQHPVTGKKAWNSARASVVARGRKLIQDKDYPSPQVLRAIADLFSRKWKQVGKRN